MDYPILQTKYNRLPHPGEVNEGPVLVNKAFVPLKFQIEQALAAGERLQEFKLAQYHAQHPEDIPEGYYDPSTEPNYDYADASQENQIMLAKAKELLAKRKAVKDVEDSTKPEEPSTDPVPEEEPAPAT